MQINTPDVWLEQLPTKTAKSHKYHSGHAVIYGAPALTGATRLAAEACARIGAGLVSVLATPESAPIYKSSLPPHILIRDNLAWRDPRVNAVLYGSGGLPCPPIYDERNRRTVLDADALHDLPKKLNPNYILTPHEGEFARAFPNYTGSKAECAVAAARDTDAYLILKGHETIIAAPDGRYVINTHAPPSLATAGTGDVLAGMVTGLVAQGMPNFEACCAAVWIHGACALQFGIGLVASDLPGLIPRILQNLQTPTV